MYAGAHACCMMHVSMYVCVVRLQMYMRTFKIWVKSSSKHDAKKLLDSKHLVLEGWYTTSKMYDAKMLEKGYNILRARATGAARHEGTLRAHTPTFTHPTPHTHANVSVVLRDLWAKLWWTEGGCRVWRCGCGNRVWGDREGGNG